MCEIMCGGAKEANMRSQNSVQPPYISLVMHNSYFHKIAHIWNRLPDVAKSSTLKHNFVLA